MKNGTLQRKQSQDFTVKENKQSLKISSQGSTENMNGNNMAKYRSFD